MDKQLRDTLVLYLKTRIDALDTLIKIHRSRTGDYLVMERAVCQGQLDLINRLVNEWKVEQGINRNV